MFLLIASFVSITCINAVLKLGKPSGIPLTSALSVVKHPEKSWSALNNGEATGIDTASLYANKTCKVFATVGNFD